MERSGTKWTMTVALINNRKYRLFPFICLAISTLLLLAGLWPFNFFPDNNVRWLSDRNGLRFDRNGIVIGKEPVFSPGGDIDFAKPWTLVLEVTPHDEPSDSLPRILSAYDSEGRELLILAQWRSELILRILQGERFFHLRYRETAVGILSRGETRSIAISSDNTGLSLHADGILLKSIPRSALSFLSQRQPHACLVLGNSPSGETPWRGNFLSLSVYPKALSSNEVRSPGNGAILHYRFSEGSGRTCRGGSDPRYDLTIPAIFRAPKKGVLIPTWKVQQFNRSFWNDVAVNVLGFIPFGFAVSAWLRKDDERKRRSSTAAAVLLGGGISLAIELLQAYLPTRDSSLTDVLTNTLGTSIGTLLFQKADRILFHRNEPLKGEP